MKVNNTCATVKYPQNFKGKYKLLKSNFTFYNDSAKAKQHITKLGIKKLNGFSGWTENWYNGTYAGRVLIYKKVLNRYNNSLSVEIICKVHAQHAKAGEYTSKCEPIGFSL